ncbi:TetR/AcrR family transcriptional regulator [Aureicoccus marinus]|jgi:AcrR family transcriptional regulator|uniref:TetR family transcriptional regulator n=1 Tax=Aureicoccus marinus TaxID=754435 RepID=A0A2S7T8S4_9FLAO|nr:TetR/AcrR family transcriptional regulator [Aureicoccus marinus]PQJ16333.1 TetR family transcriptional regulator [Aureicoccus marinus]
MHRQEIKQHIIDTAGKLFYKQGYNATGINEIISEASIAKATLYNHFKSKEDICLAYLEGRHIHFLDALKAYCQEKPQGPPRLLALFDYLREVYREPGFYGDWGQKVYAELPPQNQKTSELIRQQKKELLMFLGELVSENVGLISVAETEHISGALYLLMESAITESHVHQSDWPIHLARRVVPSLFEEKLAR